MPSGTLLVNLLSVIAFFALWAAYELLFDGPLRRRGSINANMPAIRAAWMARMMERENLIVDSSLIGNSLRTATFFASTTILILAGLVGVFGSSDRIYGAMRSISMIITVDQQLFEWKIALLMAIFAHTFFKFTWAIRQFNYMSALIGSTPKPPPAADEIRRHAERMAVVLGHGIAALNAGFRGYYFAFAALGWIVHPAVLVAGAAFMVLVLARRQLWSPASRAIDEHAAWLAGRGTR
jgi:uncharacterized membrane protein